MLAYLTYVLEQRRKASEFCGGCAVRNCREILRREGHATVFAVTLLGRADRRAGDGSARASARCASLPARGPHPVGARDFVIDDAERPLDVTVWYPALNPDGVPETASYLLGNIFPVPGQALRDAAPDAAGGPYPLVIFSHGFGGFRAQSTYLTEHLASHGSWVMAADHPGSHCSTCSATMCAFKTCCGW